MIPAAIRNAFDFVSARRKAGLSDETMTVLLVLRRDGELLKSVVAERAEINPTTLPRYLSSLVASGHVAKRRCPGDRREVLYTLTGHGCRLVESLLKHFPAHD